MKRRFLSPFVLTQVLMVAVIAAALWLAYWPWRWGQVRDEVRTRFPAVTHIEGTKLQQWLVGRVAPPVLLDVRSTAEFEVSHLPGARHVMPGAPLADNQLVGKENAQVVIYDAVGFEASAFATMLLQHKFTDVQVLDGGIFQWANEGRTLIGPGGALTTKVQPGPSEYALLLDRARRTH